MMIVPFSRLQLQARSGRGISCCAGRAEGRRGGGETAGRAPRHKLAGSSIKMARVIWPPSPPRGAESERAARDGATSVPDTGASPTPRRRDARSGPSQKWAGRTASDTAIAAWRSRDRGALPECRAAADPIATAMATRAIVRCVPSRTISLPTGVFSGNEVPRYASGPARSKLSVLDEQRLVQVRMVRGREIRPPAPPRPHRLAGSQPRGISAKPTWRRHSTGTVSASAEQVRQHPRNDRRKRRRQATAASSRERQAEALAGFRRAWA